MANQKPSQDPANATTGRDDTTPATVVIGDVQADQFNANYSDTGSDIDIITDYKIHNYYENDQHTYMAGVTSPSGFQGSAISFFRLATKTQLWISDWTACKLNSQPEVPDPYSVDSSWVLLDVIIKTASVALSPDGVTGLYRIEGTYVFGQKNPSSNAFVNISFGRPAWMSDTLQYGRTMPVNKLTANLIESPEVSVNPIDQPINPVGHPNLR